VAAVIPAREWFPSQRSGISAFDGARIDGYPKGPVILRSTGPVVGAIGAALALVVIGVLWFGTGAAAPPPVVSIAPPTLAPEPNADQPDLVVYVSGSVARPGLVTIAAGSRVADAIAAAGGALRTANLAGLNLAASVRDAEHVHVPDIATPDVAPHVVGTGPAGVDLNAADAAALEALPGVGPVLAERIVAHRTEYGPFTTVEDLLDVPGIGEAKLAQLRDSVRSP
jgi:competence protein ComEA